MDDLAGKINAILNDPQAMQQVSALAGMLGNSGGQQAPQAPPANAQPVDSGALASLGSLGNLGALANLLGGQQNQPGQPPAMNSETMQAVLQIMPLLNSFQQEDDQTRLLHSLRPLLSRERQKKLDEAARMIKIFRLLPLLKSKGIL